MAAGDWEDAEEYFDPAADCMVHGMYTGAAAQVAALAGNFNFFGQGKSQVPDGWVLLEMHRFAAASTTKKTPCT